MARKYHKALGSLSGSFEQNTTFTSTDVANYGGTTGVTKIRTAMLQDKLWQKAHPEEDYDTVRYMDTLGRISGNNAPIISVSSIGNPTELNSYHGDVAGALIVCYKDNGTSEDGLSIYMWDATSTSAVNAPYLMLGDLVTGRWVQYGGAKTNLSNLSSTSVNTHIVPSSDSLRDLGTPSRYWRRIYVDAIYTQGSSIFLGDLKLSASGIGANAKLKVEAKSDTDATAYSSDNSTVETSFVQNVETSTGGSSSLVLRAEGSIAVRPDYNGNSVGYLKLQSTRDAGVTYIDDVVFHEGGTFDVRGDVVPMNNFGSNLGSRFKKFNTLWARDARFDKKSLYLGDLKITSVNTGSSSILRLEKPSAGNSSQYTPVNTIVEADFIQNVDTSDGGGGSLVLRAEASIAIRPDHNGNSTDSVRFQQTRDGGLSYIDTVKISEDGNIELLKDVLPMRVYGSNLGSKFKKFGTLWARTGRFDKGTFYLGDLKMTQNGEGGTSRLRLERPTTVGGSDHALLNSTFEAQVWQNPDSSGGGSGSLIMQAQESIAIRPDYNGNSTNSVLFQKTLDSGGSYVTRLEITEDGHMKTTDGANDGNPVWQLGADDNECLHIQAYYDSGTAVLDYVQFTTKEVSNTANKGKIRFAPDQGSVFEINDNGIDVQGSQIDNSTGALTVKSSLGALNLNATTNVAINIDSNGDSGSNYFKVQKDLDTSPVDVFKVDENADVTEVRNLTMSQDLVLSGKMDILHNATNYMRTDVTTYGATTVLTVDGIGSSGHYTLDIDGDIILDSATGKFKWLNNGTEFSATDSAYAGCILGYTHLDKTTGIVSYTLGTTYAVPSTLWRTTFIVPPSGNVEIILNFYRDSSTSNEVVYASLSSSSTYTTYDLGQMYDYGVDNADETDDRYVTVKWVITGLTAGTSTTIYIGLRASTGTTYVKYGGTDSNGRKYPPVIIKTSALPESILT